MPFLIQRLLAAVGLIVLGPVLFLMAVAVRATSVGPAFHRATRARPGGTFTLFKLRTMRVDAVTTGPAVTAGGDRRVTAFGRFLRRTKLDELPQLWNVVRGDLALVGPRPEDPRYVDLADPLHRIVFGARPGITGAASIAFRDEETILADAALQTARHVGRETALPEDLERAYRDEVLPRKLALDAEYLRTRSCLGDLRILAKTLRPGG